MRLALFSIFVFTTLACAPRSDHGGRSFFDPLLGKNQYVREFQEHTQERSVSSNFDIILKAAVTYWNTDLREAYIDEYSRSFRLSEEEQAALTLEQLAEDESYYVFILTAMTRDPRFNDFDKANSVWRLSLEDNRGRQTALAERVEVLTERAERNAHFYPSMSRFGRTYRVYFPKYELDDPETIVMFISGPYGSLSFSFDTPKQASRFKHLEVQ